MVYSGFTLRSNSEQKATDFASLHLAMGFILASISVEFSAKIRELLPRFARPWATYILPSIAGRIQNNHDRIGLVYMSVKLGIYTHNIILSIYSNANLYVGTIWKIFLNVRPPQHL